MHLTIKKILFTLSYNSILFLLLIIGLQNSLNKSKVNLLVDTSVKLPIGFIVGVSFISGSIIGSVKPIFFSKINK